MKTNVIEKSPLTFQRAKHTSNWSGKEAGVMGLPGVSTIASRAFLNRLNIWRLAVLTLATTKIVPSCNP
jgi:hypothetical protein